MDYEQTKNKKKKKIKRKESSRISLDSRFDTFGDLVGSFAAVVIGRVDIAIIGNAVDCHHTLMRVFVGCWQSVLDILGDQNDHTPDSLHRTLDKRSNTQNLHFASL